MSARTFSHPVSVRYLEVDQQGVVFNMWYLAYFDDALTALFEATGVPYGELLGEGVDVQLVHTEMDWLGPLGFGDDATVDVGVARLGRSSFTLEFAVRAGDRVAVTASSVYVVVGTDGSGSRPIPPRLREALGRIDPLGVSGDEADQAAAQTVEQGSRSHG